MKKLLFSIALLLIVSSSILFTGCLGRSQFPPPDGLRIEIREQFNPHQIWLRWDEILPRNNPIDSHNGVRYNVRAHNIDTDEETIIGTVQITGLRLDNLLDVGDYEISVQATGYLRGGGGAGNTHYSPSDWSEPIEFRWRERLRMLAGSFDAPTRVLSWMPVNGAVEYELRVERNGVEVDNFVTTKTQFDMLPYIRDATLHGFFIRATYGDSTLDYFSSYWMLLNFDTN
jgi:hypothetical protein